MNRATLHQADRAAAVRHIVARLRARCADRKDTDNILDEIRLLAPADSAARELLGDLHKRANLKRIAFPESGADSKPSTTYPIAAIALTASMF